MIKNLIKLTLATLLAACLTQTSQAQYPLSATGYTNLTVTVVAKTNIVASAITATSFFNAPAGRTVWSMTISNAGAEAIRYDFGVQPTTNNITLAGNSELLEPGAVLTYPTTTLNFIPPVPLIAKATNNATGSLVIKAWTH